jgi:carbon monoxide dehydrogenase subunit G
MKFENSFAVHAPLPVVWKALMDIERVAPCMPGAEVLGRADGDAYKVGVRVKVGPMSMLYRGQVEISERDDAAHSATLRARARESRGQGTANALVHMTVAEQPDGTQATMETELQLSGRAASMGRGVLSDVSEQLIDEFSNNLAAMLASGEAETAAAPGPADTTAAPGAAPSPPASALPAGRIAARAIANRLGEPRTLLLATATVAAVFGVIGYVIGRAH